MYIFFEFLKYFLKTNGRFVNLRKQILIMLIVRQNSTELSKIIAVSAWIISFFISYFPPEQELFYI